MVVQFIKNRLEYTDNQYSAKSKTNRACQTNMPIDVANMPAIIPPASAKFPFKPNSGTIFQYSTKKTRKKKYIKRMPAKPIERKHKDNAANAINRKIRTAVDTSVYKSMCGDKVQ